MATVLLVEDNPLVADCLQRWLAAAGHATILAGDAQTALDALDEQPADVVLLDMLLPGANGVQVLHTMRSYADLAAIPVVICSSVVIKHTADLEAYGVKKVINKTTLDRKTLCAAVQEVLA